ncbi:hypothetical protein DBB29_12330 [Pandoraea cepalis]|uniref:Uncharacterized protein n=1 Tax=Pandoraea cepalis TaxID=2508294 RepID=A0AAW7MH30_9BURK|nr:hypothetical protein [Pandoraea cepalis]MDN4572056.1 hypothetical protein [Pandoraea cepalis]MDN4578902.1 hypothetical protein [Pandoraea cepalis]
MADAVEELVRDIFAATGQKVSRDDPIVAAALVNARLIRDAGEHATQGIGRAVDAAAESLAAAAGVHEAAKVSARESVSCAKDEVAAAAKAAAISATEQVREQMERIAADSIRSAIAVGEARAPSAWKLKVAVVGGVLVVGCLLTGVLAGAWLARSASPQLSEQQQRELAAGKDFLAILPVMDPTTKAKVVRLIKESGRGS